jgi:hypothetical protein
MSSLGLDLAKSLWSAEVDTVAAGLIENGMAPWPALTEATRIVRERRQRSQSVVVDDQK